MLDLLDTLRRKYDMVRLEEYYNDNLTVYLGEEIYAFRTKDIGTRRGYWGNSTSLKNMGELGRVSDKRAGRRRIRGSCIFKEIGGKI